MLEVFFMLIITSIFITWHSKHTLFSVHLICHDDLNMMQTKVLLSLMSASDVKLKMTSKKAVFSICNEVANKLNI